jgi:hypothetical protein
MADDVVDVSRFYNLNGDEFHLETEVHHDVSGILAQNELERKKSNGFSDGRTMRKIMSISVVDYLNALKEGYKIDEADPIAMELEVKRYLRDKGKVLGYQTVEHILTQGKSPNIIIK